MANLLCMKSNKLMVLLPHHIFGRHQESADTLLLNREASRVHAIISWDGMQWTINDLSKNGTFINQKKISAKTPVVLQIGDTIDFGDNQNQSWLIENLATPCSILHPMSPNLSDISLKGVIALPSEESPVISLFQSINGHWLCDSEHGISVLSSGDIVGSNGSFWRFIEATPCATTVNICANELLPLQPVILEFIVSQNEEHVKLSLHIGEEIVDLRERSSHYVFLLLARKRLSDIDKNIDESEQGWLAKDRISKLAGLDINHINIHCHRFRKSIYELAPRALDVSSIIETRRGEIRLNCKITIIGGFKKRESTSA